MSELDEVIARLGQIERKLNQVLARELVAKGPQTGDVLLRWWYDAVQTRYRVVARTGLEVRVRNVADQMIAVFHLDDLVAPHSCSERWTWGPHLTTQAGPESIS